MNCLTKTIFSFSLVALTISARANDKSAPNFAMPASDGHSYTLRTLGNGKPLLLMFFAAGCEHTPSGISDLNRLQTLFGSKVQIAGMVNLDPRQTKLLAVQHHARFPILSDQMAETIGAYGGVASLDNALVLPNGDIAHKWNGYDQSTLKQVEILLDKRLKLKFKLNLSSFPKDRKSGCAIAMKM